MELLMKNMNEKVPLLVPLYIVLLMKNIISKQLQKHIFVEIITYLTQVEIFKNFAHVRRYECRSDELHCYGIKVSHDIRNSQKLMQKFGFMIIL